MAISLNRYVNIKSTVGAGTVVPTKLLVCRMFTGSNILPPETFIQFSSAADVGTYFGLTSEEYYRALFYFAWVSKTQDSAPAIQFARIANVDSAPQLFSAPQTQTLVGWKSITDGAFTLTIAGTSNLVSGLYFSTISSFTDVAQIIQDAIVALYSEQDSATLASSITVTGIASTAALSIGMVVTGVGIPAGTTIATIASGTSVTLSQAATITGVSTLTFSLASNAMYVDSTVVFNNNSYVFTGGVTGAATISVSPPASGTDISGIAYLGWVPMETYPNGVFSQAIYDTSATWVNGVVAESITTALTNSQAASNNFGSFLFLNNLNFNLAQVQEAAIWNAASNQNNSYLYSIPVIAANVSTWAAGLSTTPGCTMTLTATSFSLSATLTNASVAVTSVVPSTQGLQVGMPVTGAGIQAGTVVASIPTNSTMTLSLPATISATESLTFSTVQFPEQCPVMIEAATDYTQNNAVQNYMFQVFDPYLTPLVTSDSTSIAYDLLSVNYYGQTQTAGSQFNFYQRGLMFGTSSTPSDQNTYVNEIWLKDSIGSSLLALQLNLTQLAANTQGRSQVLLAIQGVINQALLNGVISVGKTLTTQQQIYVGSVTNDKNAWYQVQNDGYWIDCVVQPIPMVTPTQYEAVYTLVYSKDDVIRFIAGSDILI